MPWKKWNVPPEVRRILEAAPKVIMANSEAELAELSVRDAKDGFAQVAYEIPGKGKVVEATVCRTKNGVAANYPEPYMRRRDPECMVIADDLPTNKARYKDRYGKDFESVRQETFDWLSKQELAVFGFRAGQAQFHIDSVVVAPANAGFFALGLALLQGILPIEKLDESFTPRAVIYVAPTFRHTHFDGKQVVVHNRVNGVHEVFSYNLYPGPSAKKGVYGILINIGEQEGWVTAHCSTVQVVTPYDNVVTFMHEGASGGGKSEMLENIHRERDGRLLIGHNLVTDEERHLTLPRGCELHPVTDDMALCHSKIQIEGSGKLSLMDAEDSWFIRVNHIEHYGVDPNLEAMTIAPKAPLLFLNIAAVPQATALIWEHIEDAPGVPCPNPRVVVPRRIVPNVVDGAVSVDIRSFGVRMPPCTKAKPSYGIAGMFHVLPSALAWLWRLTAPRGHANPSIVSTEGMSSEGVGSYWPFATGRRVDQANLLLEQILETPRTLFTLIPNQHVGSWKTGFMPEWLAREYLARRGTARFRPDQTTPARCPLLGYAMNQLQIEGNSIPPYFLQVDLQPEVGPQAYDAGARQLQDFFEKQLRQFLEPDLMPEGRRIIEACLDQCSVEEYVKLSAQEESLAAAR